jgi:hypothetical protein
MRYGVITLMLESVHIPEMSVFFYETSYRKIPEGCHLKLYLFLSSMFGSPKWVLGFQSTHL